MKLWLLLLPGGTLILLAIWILKRRFDRDHVSEAWLTDQDRRSCGRGLDGVTWKWDVLQQEDKLRRSA